MWWNTGTVIVEQCSGRVWWNSDGGTVWWKSGTVLCNSVVEQWNSDGGTVWWNTGTVIVEQCGGTVMVEQSGGTVEQCVQQCCGTVEQ